MKSPLPLLSLGIAIVSAAAAAPVDFGDNSYELVVVENPYAGTNNSWDTARDNAASRSYRGIAGHLVTITSAEENQWVASLSNETGVAAVWLGGRDGNGWLVGPEAGQSFVFTAWGGAEPNNSGYVYMNIGAGDFGGVSKGGWLDDSDSGAAQGLPFPNTDPVVGYVVEYEGTAYREPSLWNSGTGHNNHYYKVFAVPAGIDWTTAEANAVAMGGHLASITTQEENDFIHSLTSQDTRFWAAEISGNGIGPWFGGFQPDGSPEPGGGWRWVDGSPFGYTHWVGAEPTNGVGSPGNAGLGIEDRLAFIGLGSLMGAGWNDYPKHPQPPQLLPVAYVVEWDATPFSNPILTGVAVTPATATTQALFTGSLVWGPPFSIAILQASRDLGISDPWTTISSRHLDASGAATFTDIPDPRAESTGAPRCFFRVKCGSGQ